MHGDTFLLMLFILPVVLKFSKRDHTTYDNAFVNKQHKYTTNNNSQSQQKYKQQHRYTITKNPPIRHCNIENLKSQVE